ncbi:MAG: phosphodiester glycosidase family protein [Beijerinckiaceae bacterium]
MRAAGFLFAQERVFNVQLHKQIYVAIATKKTIRELTKQAMDFSMIFPKWTVLLISGLFLGGAAVFGGLYAYAGLYGINAVLKRGGTVFATVTPTDNRISPSMRLALLPEPPSAEAGAFTWTAAQPGFEIAEMPVMAAGKEVDRILLARIAPSSFRFQVLMHRAGNRDIDDWMRITGAQLVINGSYFDRHGYPDTPLKTNGQQMGPVPYKAAHGIFSVTNDSVTIHDLLNQDWRPLLEKSQEAMVSYPLLLSEDGTTRVKSDRRWLAVRSFVALDREGRVVLGTSKDGFFSLERLGMFLKSTPLDLRIALNLDGGPLGCQAIAAPGLNRSFCGEWETQTKGDEIILLQRVFGQRRWGLPIVLAVFPK